MKYFKLLIFPASFFVTFSSCKKSFVEKEPISDLTAGNYYTTADRLEKLLIGAYSEFQNEYFQYDYYLNSDGRSDNCYINGDGAAAEWPLENLTYNPSNGNITRDWRYLYNSIKAANVVLENIPNISDPALTSAVKAHISGEASFIRAYLYFQLVTQWGDCPLIVTTNNNGDLYPARSKAEDVYAQIISDLKNASSLLSPTPYNGQVGRITKGAADAMLAKAYAQVGDYSNCLTHCNAVLDGPYTLVSDYAKLWGVANKNNSEAIFEIQHKSSSAGLWGSELFGFFSGDNWPKRNTPAHSLVNDYKAQNDSVRLNISVQYNTVNIAFAFPVGAYKTDVDPKLPFPNKLPGVDGSWNRSENQTLLRLADIILLKAEALNQTGQTGAAIPLVNQIRDRVGLPAIAASSQSDVGLAILNERRLELAFEGHRWLDLLRADRNGLVNIITLLNSLSGESGPLNFNVNTDRHQLLFPIPLQDLQLNKNLVQNQGY